MPDDADCSEVLDRVYEYLHHELDEAGSAQVQQHLQACGHCLRQYGLEREVQDLIARSCRCMSAPDQLRQRIIQRITEVRVTRAGMSGGAFFSDTTVSYGLASGPDSAADR